MNKTKQGIAKSRYRQLRLTATHEVSGRFSVALYGKGLNADWREHDCLARYSIDGPARPLQSTEDVIQALLLILEDYLLPVSRDQR